MTMKKLLTIILLALAAFPAVAGEPVPEGSTKAERNLVRKGNSMFNDSNYHAALEQYEQALALNPMSVYALYNKAAALIQLASDDNKDTENDPRKAAAQIFNEIAKNNIEDYPRLAANSSYNLGNMAFNDGDYDAAIAAYKASLRIRPDNLKAKQNLLLALQKKEEQEQNQDQQDQQQDQQDQDQQQQQQEQQQQEQQEQQQEQQQQQQQMSQNAEQMMQAVQNKENATRRREQQPAQPAHYTTDKPW